MKPCKSCGASIGECQAKQTHKHESCCAGCDHSDG